MEDKKETQKRKSYAKDGERAQKMFSFRLDQHLMKWLEKQGNKGRYINTLIERDRTRWYRENLEEDEDELPPGETDGVRTQRADDYQP